MKNNLAVCLLYLGKLKDGVNILETAVTADTINNQVYFCSVVESPQFCTFSTPALRSKKRHFLHSGEYSGVLRSIFL